MKEIIVTNIEESNKFGKKIAENLVQGNVIGLIGDLGTGKTHLTKAIAENLGIKENITSPTYNIVKEYTGGRMPLYHFDVYRINDYEELFEIGIEEYFYGKGVSVVEWADLIKEILPSQTKIIKIEYGKNEFERIYKVMNLEEI